MTQSKVKEKTRSAIQFAHQAEKLSLEANSGDSDQPRDTTAVHAKFITPLDPVIETASGERLPGVPPAEALKFNKLKDEVEGRPSGSDETNSSGLSPKGEREIEELSKDDPEDSTLTEHSSSDRLGKLDTALPPSRTHPLFPPLPLYGPPSPLRNFQCAAFRVSSFFLSLAFLAVIVLGAAFTSIPLMLRHIAIRLTFRNPDSRRPFHEEEERRRKARKAAELEWKRQSRRQRSRGESEVGTEERLAASEGYVPTEGGLDPIVCDVGYYARRVGLDVEKFRVQTEDGFIIELWHVFNPKEYVPLEPQMRDHKKPEVVTQDQVSDGDLPGACAKQFQDGNRRYPVLLMHGLLQSSGAYCTNDEDSLAFFLCKSGYDVWLGNNRCGFNPEHTLLKPNDPRMWAWNIRAFGVMDLPALVSRVLAETGFKKLGLVCHSQGTTETFVALAKEQRPDLGEKISVFCALAPAAYAGPLIGKMYFKFMRIISPGMFRVFFGIHAFIPFMMSMHRLLPPTLYGALGYRVFAFLFNWTDDRWERDLRDRMFQFAPVYVSAESMRWWLGRECFARQKCILATREEGKREEHEDADDMDEVDHMSSEQLLDRTNTRGHTAWYNEQVPPFALWICGNDQLVDGRKLLQRFERGREPHVKVVHASTIEEYEHLDVLWAMDSIDKVAKPVRDVIWDTLPEDARKICRIPSGCKKVSRGEA